MDDRPAHAGAGEGEYLQQLSFFCEAFEAVAGAVGDEQRMICPSRVPADAMGVVKMGVPVAAATKIIDELPCLIVVEDVLGAVAVGNKNIAVGIDGGLGRHEFFLFFIDAGVKRGIDGQRYFTVQGGLVYLVADDVGNI